MAFNYCVKLTALPEELFWNCPKVESFKQCFYNCGLLESIPEDIFKYNKVVTDFSGTFNQCINVKGMLPEFWLRGVEGTAYEDYTAPTSYSGCFYGCTKADNYNEAGNYGWN